MTVRGLSRPEKSNVLGECCDGAFFDGDVVVVVVSDDLFFSMRTTDSTDAYEDIDLLSSTLVAFWLAIVSIEQKVVVV